jgi:LysR family transcriptional regulator, glycine cleavage system transcriptional activator
MSEIRRLLPSLNTLVAFEAAVRCGTFARAARELGVTGPAVSRTIGRLELHLGVPLFRRTPSGVVLTRDGDELFSGVSQSFGEIERTLIRLKERECAMRRPIVLSVSSAFATHWFMPRLAAFQARFPGQEIRFHLVNGPLAGPVDGFDLAMRFDHKPDARHRVRTLMPELLLPICARHFKEDDTETDALLRAATRMITLTGSQPDWASLFTPAALGSGGPELQFSDYTLVVQAALVGQGIALGWLSVVSKLLAEGRLVPAHSAVVSTGRQCQLITAGARGLPVAEEIGDWVMDEFRTDISAIKARYPALDMTRCGPGLALNR